MKLELSMSLNCSFYVPEADIMYFVLYLFLFSSEFNLAARASLVIVLLFLLVCL
jgi:hypothetical protein